MKFFPLLAFLILLAAPAMAQLDSPTPQYSGPSASFDNGYGAYGAARSLERRAAPDARRDAAIARDDAGVDAQVRSRNAVIRSEMARKREDARRANDRRAILRLND